MILKKHHNYIFIEFKKVLHKNKENKAKCLKITLKQRVKNKFLKIVKLFKK